MHEVLVNRLVKLAQEKSGVRFTDHPDMTIAVDWDVKYQTNQMSTAKLTLILPVLFCLKMLSAFYVCYIYSSGIQTIFFHGSKECEPPRSSLIWVHNPYCLQYSLSKNISR